jgi:hypothetical protein
METRWGWLHRRGGRNHRGGGLERLFPERGWKPWLLYFLYCVLTVWKGFSPRGDGNRDLPTYFQERPSLERLFPERGWKQRRGAFAKQSTQQESGKAFPREGMETTSSSGASTKHQRLPKGLERLFPERGWKLVHVRSAVGVFSNTIACKGFSSKEDGNSRATAT